MTVLIAPIPSLVCESSSRTMALVVYAGHYRGSRKYHFKPGYVHAAIQIHRSQKREK
jgi:hypothetical protein